MWHIFIECFDLFNNLSRCSVGDFGASTSMARTRDVVPNTHLGLTGQNVSLERSVIPGGSCLVAVFPRAQAKPIGQNHLIPMARCVGRSFWLRGWQPKAALCVLNPVCGGQLCAR